VGEAIASDKQLTKTMLRSVGAPVPNGRIATSASDAWSAATALGLPVVVKPLDGNQGRGVSIALTTQAEIEEAFALAQLEGTSVVVENWVPGTAHRLLVVAGRVVAASRAEPEQVIGDGCSTIRQLVSDLNQDPKRGDRQDKTMSFAVIDQIALAVLRTQGLTPETAPKKGRSIILHYNGDYTADETEIVHHSVAMHAVRAARAVGLDIAGIDVVAEDISIPLEEQGGRIVEVNAGPSLKMHVQPIVGRAQPVGDAIVKSMFSPGANGRIPIIAIAAGLATEAAASYALKQLSHSRLTIGFASERHAFVGDQPLAAEALSNAEKTELVLLNPLVDVAVVELTAESLASEGLPFDRPRIALITDSVPTKATSAFGIRTQAETARLKGLLLENLTSDDWAILNADDPFVARLAHRTHAKVVYYTTGDPSRLVDGSFDQLFGVTGSLDGLVVRAQVSQSQHETGSTNGARIKPVELRTNGDGIASAPSSAEAALDWVMELAIPAMRRPFVKRMLKAHHSS